MGTLKGDTMKRKLGISIALISLVLVGVVFAQGMMAQDQVNPNSRG